MAERIVNLHDTVTSYIANAPDKNIATKIGDELLKLSRAVVKHHTLPEQQHYKYYLVQPSRMLAEEVYRWNHIEELVIIEEDHFKSLIMS